MLSVKDAKYLGDRFHIRSKGKRTNKWARLHPDDKQNFSTARGLLTRMRKELPERQRPNLAMFAHTGPNTWEKVDA